MGDTIGRRADASRVAEDRASFPQGVASGDPDDRSVVLWTRRPFDQGERQALTVEVARDADFRRVVAKAHAPVLAAADWTFRALVGGLLPATTYWYRFTDDSGAGSRIGRTITAPRASDPRPPAELFSRVPLDGLAGLQANKGKGTSTRQLGNYRGHPRSRARERYNVRTPSFSKHLGDAMKILTFLVMLVFGSAALAQNPEVEQLKDLARLFGEAWLSADIHTLDHLLAKEYTHTDITGSVLHREDWLADAANAQKWLRAPEGNAKPSIEFDDMDVDLSGDLAVITGRNVIHSANPETKVINLRFTQVWAKENGEWKRRFFQATPVVDSKE